MIVPLFVLGMFPGVFVIVFIVVVLIWLFGNRMIRVVFGVSIAISTAIGMFGIGLFRFDQPPRLGQPASPCGGAGDGGHNQNDKQPSHNVQ